MEAVCPLCGDANDCGRVAGERSCWCFSEHIRAEVLAELVNAGRDGACLCRACALEGARSPCIGECMLDPTESHCIGCRRTLEEIGAWSEMSALERARVRLRLDERSRNAG